MTEASVDNTVYSVSITREDGQYAAYCKELGVASCGDNSEEARENILDAIELYLDTIEELGESA